MIFTDHAGKPSAMRAASVAAVAGGVVVMVANGLGLGAVDVSASDLLWMIGIGLGAKGGQAIVERRPAA